MKKNLEKIKNNFKKWAYSASIRAIRTFIQTALGLLAGSSMFSEVNWAIVLSSAAFAALLSLGTSALAGLPEVPEDKNN